MKGVTTDFSILQLLNLIHLTKKNGTLTVTHEGRQARLAFLEGRLVWASVGQRGGDLADILLAAGRISPPQARILQQQAALHGDKGLATYFTQQATRYRFTVSELARLLKRHLLLCVSELSDWPDSTFSFDEDTLPDDQALILPVSLEKVVSELAHRQARDSQLEEEIPALDVRLEFPSSAPVRFQDIDLNADDWRVLSNVHPDNTARMIADKLEMKDRDIRRVIGRLRESGLVELVTLDGQALRPAPDSDERRKQIVDRLIDRLSPDSKPPAAGSDAPVPDDEMPDWLLDTAAIEGEEDEQPPARRSGLPPDSGKAQQRGLFPSGGRSGPQKPTPPSPPAPSEEPDQDTAGDIPDFLAEGALDDVDAALAWLEEVAAKYDPDFEATPSTGEAPQEPEPAPQPPREDVRFTAFHPKEAAAETWYTLLAYVHLPDLIEQVTQDAEKFSDEMGGAPRAVKVRQTVGLQRGTELLLVPEADGVEFKPHSLSLTWDEDIERANFRFKAGADLIDRPAIGEVTVYAGPVEIANIPFAIPIVAEVSGDSDTTSASADMHDRVFVSYSHQNSTIVKASIQVLQGLGLEIYADYISLRSGDDWDARLLEMIEESDVFQLFWSPQAAESQAVRREWTHALGLKKEPEGARPGVGYIRPVYWEEPLPDIPPELAHIHFKHVPELIAVAERLA